MTFKELNLNKPLWNALDDADITHPTTIQHKVFPVAMSGRDIIGIAQTGTGKTLAYLLPIMRMWTFNKSRHTTALIIVPTRELVVQVVEVAMMLGKYMNIVIRGVYGGTNLKTQAYELAEGCDILVGTPGRLLDLGYHGSLNLKAVKKLVIDEVDEMLALGFRSQLEHILDLLSGKRQNLMFSATITEEVEKLIEAFFNSPEKIEAAPAGSPLSNINQSLYRIPNFNTKVNLLQLLLRQNQSLTKVLVFVATKALADELYDRINDEFLDQIGIIHSNKDQNFRFNAVNRFQDGTLRVLIATDIIARGLDIEDVSHVINFDLPDEPNSYIHRIGRTGRADKRGEAIAFVGDLDVQWLEEIEALMQYQIPVATLPEDLVISDVLTESEIPKVHMKNTLGKLPKINDEGSAFHEKKAKNQKSNVKIRHKDKMHAKYGKPKTRGQKPRGKKR
ncbi:MAG: DEAD/DEAH box helicase [Saprospiraceae bacterium]|nr:MAG: DEAD/DEAH box helicase [Bacteroidetes bacterium OLB9]MCO6463967.1 DEAD/DEAH box helicase [Saprospiraceae bacterium]